LEGVQEGEAPPDGDYVTELGTTTVRILVADDHDIIRRGLNQLLASRPGWEVCGEAKTGRQAVALAAQLKPEVVVMDISIPDLNGLETARRVRTLFPQTRTLILTVHLSDDLIASRLLWPKARRASARRRGWAAFLRRLAGRRTRPA
jgi:CheY-like chemotaxis protein